MKEWRKEREREIEKVKKGGRGKRGISEGKGRKGEGRKDRVRERERGDIVRDSRKGNTVLTAVW